MPPKISQSTKKYQADMAKAFRTADKDNDGFLTKKEYVQVGTLHRCLQYNTK